VSQGILGALLGFVLGAAVTLSVVRSDTGGLFLGSSHRVEDLERRLREVELQREQLGRQLEDATARAARMEAGFKELEQRFQALAAQRTPP
jgi:hypothetical protein